jgi:Secretion system C-terminal sorting domain
MKKFSLFILAMICSVASVLAQRTVDHAFTVPAPDYGAATFKGTTLGDHSYVAAREAFYEFDETSTVSYDYPVRDGVQLSISRLLGGTNIDTWTMYHNRTLPTLNSVVYLNLTNESISACNPYGCELFLYQFADGIITPSPIADPVLSNVVVFQNKIYAVVKFEGTGRLISFDGSTVTVIIPSLEVNHMTALYATDQYLYLADHRFGTPWFDTDVFVKRFDGSTVIDIPSFHQPLSVVREIYQLPGEETVYFHSESDITRFDGSIVTEIAEIPGGGLDYLDMAVIDNMAYYITTDTYPAVLYRSNGSVTEVVTLPDGANIISSTDALLVYEDELFIASYLPSGAGAIYRYNGTTFTRLSLGTTSHPSPRGLYERYGKLLVHTSSTSYEYYRGSICTIESNGYSPFTNLSTAEYHVWWKSDHSSGEYNLEYAIERKTGCGGSTIIPAPLIDFDLVDIRTIGPERGWCWNEIDFDWNILCLPPSCIDPEWQVSMTDSNNKVAFQKQFSKPTDIAIPLADVQSYDLSVDLYNRNNKSFERVFSIDEELVPLGISGISLSMKPKEGRIVIDAQTDKNKEIPLQLTLLSDGGEALWQETFVAPLNKEFSGTVDKSGVSLRLSAITSLDKIDKSEWKVNYYPNPFTNKITVEFDPEKKAPVNFAIYSMQGDQLQYTVTESTGSYTLEIDPKNKQGLYILSIRSGDKELRKLIELRYAK